MHEGCVRDGRLFTQGHVEPFDPTQVLEGSVRDGYLAAVLHIERLNPAQVHKGRVRDPIALRHVHRVQPCARVASNMNEIRIDDRSLSPDSEIDVLPILTQFR